ncbi:hypothetical protein NDU88_009279 [Pleurodeles waltl]|uniref:Uncharacterized protein n=1 Tax=Pleurodeles waltl TaxID=8319 RepID=A0AAV7QU42_PLEWA|nr:hypothetical protein NDU88_009279 [Pleurodeles waltl]
MRPSCVKGLASLLAGQLRVKSGPLGAQGSGDLYRRGHQVLQLFLGRNRANRVSSRWPRGQVDQWGFSSPPGYEPRGGGRFLRHCGPPSGFPNAVSAPSASIVAGPRKLVPHLDARYQTTLFSVRVSVASVLEREDEGSLDAPWSSPAVPRGSGIAPR